MLSVVKNQRREVFGQDKTDVIDDVRQAERELDVALWRFHDALGQDQVDYAIYSLEAAEKKLDMLLRKAKRIWELEIPQPESGGEGG